MLIDDVLASDRTLIKAVLMSDVYESQLAVLDYYSEMLKRRSEEEVCMLLCTVVCTCMCV